MDTKLLRQLEAFQREERTEYIIYSFLARRVKGKNGEVLKKIALDELKHYEFWRKYTGRELRPYYFSIFKYILLQFFFGITFTLKLMEGGEKDTQEVYSNVIKEIEDARDVLHDEVLHERALLNMIDEERIGYISSMILGLNDALVELTGALAGLTLSLQHRKTVVLAGFITGIAAALSMAASEYLSTKSEAEHTRSPVKSAFYTGMAYIFTVILLLLPYVFIPNILLALLGTVIIAIFIIYFFTFFVSVVHEKPFGRSFLEMFIISMGVASISFGIGYLIRRFLNIDI